MKTSKPGKGGKQSKQEMLPSRYAMNQITKGEPLQRMMNNYAKKTPSGPTMPGMSFVGMSRF